LKCYFRILFFQVFYLLYSDKFYQARHLPFGLVRVHLKGSHANISD
jgi:hypothetical protein